MATYTPIPYWLSLPWIESCSWAASVLEMLPTKPEQR